MLNVTDCVSGQTDLWSETGNKENLIVTLNQFTCSLSSNPGAKQFGSMATKN